MREETKIRLRERKSQPRKSMFRPAKTEKRQMAPVLLLPLWRLALSLSSLSLANILHLMIRWQPIYAAKLSAPGGSHLFGTDNVEEMFSQEYCTGPAIPLC